jgi:hypothetical protein
MRSATTSPAASVHHGRDYRPTSTASALPSSTDGSDILTSLFGKVLTRCVAVARVDRRIAHAIGEMFPRDFNP